MNEKKFEDALQELEKIVSEMESEGLGLDDSIKKYESGIKLAAYCRNKLDKAEKKIEILTRKPDGTVDLKDFSDSSENESDPVQATVETKISNENIVQSEENTTIDSDEEQVDTKPELKKSKEDIEVSKLSDSDEIVEEIEDNTESIDINEPVVIEDENSFEKNNTSEENITEDQPDEIKSYDDGYPDITVDEPEDKFDDIKENKPKKVPETKPQDHEETFEDLLF